MFLKKMRIFITGMSVLCVALSLAGCSGREVAIPTESNTEQAEEGISEVSALEDANVEATAGESGLDSERSNFFSEMPDSFAFSSGAGAWATYVEISEDGSFTGQYHDSDMGDIGEGYPYGTVYICDFYGRFSEPESTDSKYIYSMKLLDLQIENEEKVGASEIVDGILYVYTTPYGFEDADEFLIYMPGSPLSEMTDAW